MHIALADSLYTFIYTNRRLTFAYNLRKN